MQEKIGIIDAGIGQDRKFVWENQANEVQFANTEGSNLVFDDLHDRMRKDGVTAVQHIGAASSLGVAGVKLALTE